MCTFLLGLVLGANLAWVLVSLPRDGYWREFNVRRRGSDPLPSRKPEAQAVPPERTRYGWGPGQLSPPTPAPGMRRVPGDVGGGNRVSGTFDEPPGEARKSAESASKPRLDLLPTAAMEAIGEVLTFGAAKYDDNNWARGARWGRYYSAMLRHLFAWWRGEDRDPETGLSHLAHAGCCLMFLLEYQRNGWGLDDRFRGPDGGALQKRDC